MEASILDNLCLAILMILDVCMLTRVQKLGPLLLTAHMYMIHVIYDFVYYIMKSKKVKSRKE